MTTPLEIEMCLHYWICPSDYGREEGRYDAPAVRAARERLVDIGILELRPLRPNEELTGPPAVYRAVREPMMLYIAALQAVPLPTRKWVMEAGLAQVDEDVLNPARVHGVVGTPWRFP